MKRLSDLLFKCNITKVFGSTDIEISAISADSREVTVQSLFVAITGTATDGHNFIEMAIDKGAKVIVCEKIPEITTSEITLVEVSDSSKALGLIAANFYDNPALELKLIGVTGTNGKTTIATLLHKLFMRLGHNSGLFSTVVNKIGETKYPATHTTPEPVHLNKMLRQMVNEGCEYCFMEVSSHAVVQNRIAGLYFTGGIFTNITHDHLDYHLTFSNYLKAKQQFFSNLPKDAFALSNIDDKNGEIIVQNTKSKKYTYSLHSNSTYKCRILENQLSGLLLNIDGQEVWARLIGNFNAYNILAIYSTAILLGKEKSEVLQQISNLEAVEGRFDYIYNTDKKIIAIVDYAHTPDALENVLTTIDSIRTRNEKLITVIGCGGNRDAKKRPIMAKIAANFSDKLILTSDNPRFEEPEAIISDMQQGVDGIHYKKTMSIINRKEAIKTACNLAEQGDIILIAGKGHEKYQEIKGVKYPFDDKQLVQEFLID